MPTRKKLENGKSLCNQLSRMAYSYCIGRTACVQTSKHLQHIMLLPPSAARLGYGRCQSGFIFMLSFCFFGVFDLQCSVVLFSFSLSLLLGVTSINMRLIKIFHL